MSTSTMDGNRPPGRPPKHGARALERLIRQNRLDKRTTTAKMLQTVANDIASDAGGWDYLSARERLLVERSAAQAVIIASLENWIFRQEVLVDGNGDMLGVLRKGYIAHVACLARNLVALGLRPDRANKVPSLAEYLASRSAGGNGTHGANDGAGSTAPAADKPTGDRVTVANAALTAVRR